MREGLNTGGLTLAEWLRIVALRQAGHRIYAERDDYGRLVGHRVDGVFQPLEWARVR